MIRQTELEHPCEACGSTWGVYIPRIGREWLECAVCGIALADTGPENTDDDKLFRHWITEGT